MNTAADKRKKAFPKVDLAETPSSDLLRLYAQVLDELRERKIIRSTNNPVADYAELLAVEALGLARAPKSTTGYDAIDEAGSRYEVKARRVTTHNKSRQLSVIRGLEKKNFSFLVGVLFAEDFAVFRACIVPVNQVRRLAKYRKHVNGWILHLTDDVWRCAGVEDITPRIQAVETRLRRGRIR